MADIKKETKRWVKTDTAPRYLYENRKILKEPSFEAGVVTSA